MTIKEAIELYETLNGQIERHKMLYDKMLEKFQEQRPFDTLKLELDITEYRMIMADIMRAKNSYEERLEEEFILT